MPFSKNDHMVQAVSADGPDQSLHVGPLPGAGWGGEDFFNAQASDSFAKVTPVDFVPISQQVTRCGVFRKGLNHLLACPPRRRMLGHVEVNYPPAVMSQHHQDKDDAKGRRGNREEIH